MNNNRKVLVSNSCVKKFALECMLYFRDETTLWNNIDSYVTNFSQGESLKVSGTGFGLTGMFKCVSKEKLYDLNLPTKRWFTDEFTIKGQTVYLTNQWNGQGNYKLKLETLGIFVSECFGKQYHVDKNENEVWELYVFEGEDTIDILPIETQIKKELKSFSITGIIQLINNTGLIFSDDLIKRVAFSLMSKRFLILSGLAGSGKTQLALTFAETLIEDESQKCVVSVGADWTNREPLLGFPNALRENIYEKPECGALDLLIEANKEENKDKPYFLILDEMNMSYVERYFADFLSVMESDEPIRLWKGRNCDEMSGVPGSVRLSDNVFIIGTINVDETTYMFSPKVLDRANVIEFKISGDDMAKFLNEMKNIDKENILGSASEMGSSFVQLARNKNQEKDSGVITVLNDLFKELSSVNAEFGYRTATEIFRFIYQVKHNDDTLINLNDKQKENLNNDIVDAAIVQKLLPKLHGSRKKLEPVLLRLWKNCFENEVKDIELPELDKIRIAKYKLSADKIFRMYESAKANGFTSFAEA